MYFVNNLKANILVSNDIIGLEGITVDPIISTVYIDSYKVIIPVEIRIPTIGVLVRRTVYVRKEIVIPLRLEALITIYYGGTLPITRDFLFEPSANIDVSLYTHLIDADTKAVIVKNDSEYAIAITRNIRIGTFIELNYLNAFYVDEELLELSI